MTDDKLLELATRCEQATGPSRHLDTQIHILLDPDAQHIVGSKPGRFPQEAIYGPRSDFWDWATDESKEPPVYAPIPEFTASLDAAMTLVPDWAKGVTVVRGENGRGACYIDKLWCAGSCDDAANPALAICAASLRSLANRETEK